LHAYTNLRNAKQHGIIEKTYELDLSDFHDRLVADRLIKVANARFQVSNLPVASSETTIAYACSVLGSHIFHAPLSWCCEVFHSSTYSWHTLATQHAMLNQYQSRTQNQGKRIIQSAIYDEKELSVPDTGPDWTEWDWDPMYYDDGNPLCVYAHARDMRMHSS